MQNIERLLQSATTDFTSILKTTKNKDSYVALDLSVNNKELATVDITNATDCESYIKQILNKTNSTIAFGGYLEKRNLYAKNDNFSNVEEVPRNIHLGVDFWTDAGTEVIVPVNGVVHSFKNNTVFGDYGPTIILKHTIADLTFYTLYGHLSLSCLKVMYVGKEIVKGAVLATLGTAEVNVGYAPHLHFQIILDIEDYVGDYPGVCSTKDLEFYKKNCPNPNLLLKM